MVATQGRVDLTVTVEVRRMVPATMAVVQEQNHALTDVDENTDVTATPLYLLVEYTV